MPRKRKYIALKGKRIGMLTVLGRVVSKTKRPRWRVVCDCGKRLTVNHNRLIHKSPKTHCGCQRRGLNTQYKVEYHAWWDAKSRCHNPEHPSYPSYGAKGVRMCQAWRDSFKCFLDSLGARPSKKYSLDRIDATGNYEPGNVRWATIKTQARNKRNTKWIKHPDTGVPIKAAELAEEMGISYQVMRKRMIDRGNW